MLLEIGQILKLKIPLLYLYVQIIGITRNYINPQLFPFKFRPRKRYSCRILRQHCRRQLLSRTLRGQNIPNLRVSLLIGYQIWFYLTPHLDQQILKRQTTRDQRLLVFIYFPL